VYGGCMARKPFKIVNDIDLSGNKLIDVIEIYRGDYTGVSASFRTLLIHAGSDSLNNDEPGGDLILRSGKGSTDGAIKVLLGDGTAGYGLTILGTSKTTLQTNNQDIILATGTAVTKITSTIDATGANTGALQVAGGAYIAKDLVLGGGDILPASGVTSWNLLNTIATTVNAFGAATTISIGSNASNASITFNTTKEATSQGDAGIVIKGSLGVAKKVYISSSLNVAGPATVSDDLTVNGGDLTTTAATFNMLTANATTVTAFSAANTLSIGSTGTLNLLTGDAIKTLNIGTGATTGTTTITIGTEGGTTPTVTLKGKTIALGTSTTRATTVTVGGAYTGNILKLVGITTGTVSLTTDVTTGTVNLFKDITTGNVYIATAGASKTYIGGNGATIYFGGSSGTTTLDTLTGASLTAFANPTTATLFSGATGLITFGNTSGSLTINESTISLPNATTLGLSTAPTGNTTINIGTGVLTSGTKTINLGTGATGGSTVITVGATGLGTTSLRGNLTFGGALTDTITVTGIITSAGIKMFDSDTTHRYTLLPGNLTADTTITLPTTSGQYITVGLRSDGRIDMKSIMAGNGTTALVPSNGGIVYSDANGFQILPGTATAKKVLLSGANGAPYWSDGTFSVSSGQSLTVSSGLIELKNRNPGVASVVTVPSGTLSFPEGIIAGDILYASSDGTLSRLAKVSAGSVLTSGNSPAWSANPSLTNITLSGDIAVNGGDITSTATTFNFVNSTVTTLNMLGASGATLNIGSNDSASRTVNLYTNFNIGTSSNLRTVNIYGAMNFGGPTGYTISWNSTDNTLEFIKL